MCGTEEQMQSSRKEETEKQDVRQYEGPNIIVTKTWLQESSLGTEVEALSKKEVAEFDRKDERRESLSLADAENKCIDLESINAETDSANQENSAGTLVGNLELHSELIVKKEAEARSEGVELSECNEFIKEDLLRTSENAAASHPLQITDDLPHFEKEIAHVANSLERRDEDETFKVGTIEELDGGFWKKNEVLKAHPSHGDEDHRVEKGQKEEKEAFTSLVITEKDVHETADAVVSLGTQNEAGDAMRPVPDFQN
ncbi:hypothetical protein HPB48_002691 [Haemaphysalis longicornis]|uniref:Uncharacterized protein n=1 Tax=Haemaphysalis longicornis TaxID=44386 RepID=A0A9J6GPU7_HAELO|nr:hypothetical protein HPB48_002691 [Haemaphysalis longicornis]